MGDDIIGGLVGAAVGLAIIGGVANAVRPRTRTVYVRSRSRPKYKRRIVRKRIVRNPLDFKIGGGL